MSTTNVSTSTATPAPPKRNTPPPPPSAKSKKAPVSSQAKASGTIAFGKPSQTNGSRIGIYGPGGIGKTTLAAILPDTVFFDLDGSLGELEIDVDIVPGIETWEDMRTALQSPGWNNVKNIVIDSATMAEEFAVQHTIKTIPHEKGYRIKRIEDYGYGQGYSHVFDTFMTILADLDSHVRAGRNVILLMHDCTTNYPNPQGEDFLRYEPRLQSPASGKASIRLRVREWLDHLLFIGYDVSVKDGKAQGCGTRTIYPVEMPHCMAKSRRLSSSFEVVLNDVELWNQLSIS